MPPQGNALDLWAVCHHLPIDEAARQLADTFHNLMQPSDRGEATRNSAAPTDLNPKEPSAMNQLIVSASSRPAPLDFHRYI